MLPTVTGFVIFFGGNNKHQCQPIQTVAQLLLKRIKTCDNYSIYRFPRMGYRVIVSKLQPLLTDEWTWSGTAISKMHKDLRDPELFGATFTLVVEDSCEFTKTIVVSDIIGVKTKKSFVEHCLNHFPKPYASPLNNVLFLNKLKPQAGPDFCPRPINNEINEIYRQRSEKLRNCTEQDPNSDAFLTHRFDSISSPLQVTFVSVDDNCGQLVLKPSTSSVNCCPLDHRLAGIILPNNG